MVAENSARGDVTGDGAGVPSTVFVLFGATGDLSRRMVLPAMYDLFCRGLMPTDWVLIGSSRGDFSQEEFTRQTRSSLDEFGPDEIAEGQWEDFAARLQAAGGGFTADNPGLVLEVISDVAADFGDDVQYVHYLAVPPEAFGEVAAGLPAHGLLEKAKVVYEKPYGDSLESFRRLDDQVHSVMSEDQVFRIDHFLGKEAVQNMHVLRFGNSMIDSAWSRAAVQQVQIDVPETLDVSQRASFFEATGTFRDMIATHLFQVAAEVAMERPETLAADDLKAARESALSAFRSLDPAEVVLGQYDGYRDLDEVADDSTSDTLAAVRLWVDTERWRGVPFVLRSGKRMASSTQLISLIMREVTGPMEDVPDSAPRLEICLSGAGELAMTLILKRPGPQLDLTEQHIDLDLSDVANANPLKPYVALLHDVLVGDRSLFTSSDGLAEAWRVADPVLQNRPDPVAYRQGSWGPKQVDELTDGLGWIAE